MIKQIRNPRDTGCFRRFDSQGKILGDRSWRRELRRGNRAFYFSFRFYRINRRIIRNRREKLIEDKQLKGFPEVKSLTYKPDQYEIEATDALEELLRHLEGSELPEESCTSLPNNFCKHPFTLIFC